MERGLQVVEEESVVFSNIEEVTEYIAQKHIRSGLFEREGGASVHLATTEARFMPD